MDRELKALTDGIAGFVGWNHADKIRLFAWFLHSVRRKERFQTADINGCYDDLHLEKTNTSQFLKQMEQRSPKELLKDAQGYYLVHRVFDEYERKYKPAPTSHAMTSVEGGIFKALDEAIPTIALSYKQVLQDLSDAGRVSYRGTAAELREVVRELLDHLAPDEDVLKTVKLDPTQKRPSMKQKATFILKMRGVGDTTRKTAEDSVGAVENSVGSLARSVYDRGSISTHIATTRSEVLTFKGYAEAVLAELLQIHR